MLTLTRKPGETICIGDDVVVHVRSIEGLRVKLSVEAPGQLIVRGEAKQKVQEKPRSKESMT